ncbi:ThiF family adenylyltransferase [Pseudodesulfovibrio sp.]|nr:ThiF family adenylyltransferase [Pseudodesulfovibrio sp.]
MPGSLSDAIRARAIRTSLPTGGEGYTLDIEATAKIAAEFSMAGHQVEAEALRHNTYPLRYLRNMDSIPAEEQIKLLESSVALIGLGGLGGTLLEILLRTGIGRIRGADGDKFEESNLNRQALASPDWLERSKADAASDRATTINPSIEFTAHNTFLTADTFPDFLQGTHLAIDALGGLKSRLALQQATTQANIPLVTGALAGWTGYVSVVLPASPGPADIMGHDNAAEEMLGCPAPAVTFMASLMATEAIKILTGSQSLLSSTMLIIDLQTLTFERISL